MRISDWSSDVCSSDLMRVEGEDVPAEELLGSVFDDSDGGVAVADGEGELAGLVRRAHPGALGCRNAALEDQPLDRKSVVEGKSVSVRVDAGGRRLIKKKIQEIIIKLEVDYRKT